MAATVTLATTRFSAPVDAGDTRVQLSSTSGIVPGVRLYVDRELIAVDRLTGVGNEVAVLRGVEGTASSRHSTLATVTMGYAHQFYTTDPVGVPPTVVPVSPYINIRTGVLWTASGDEAGAGNASRSWTASTVSAGTATTVGALGILQPSTS